MQRYWRSSWAHFTSWWVYPVILVLAVLILVLLAARVAEPIPYVAIRLVAFGAVVTWLYDEQVRKKRKSRKAQSPKS